VPPIAHDFLMVRNDKYEYQPQLAVSGISLADGTWRVNADGTMATTWKLRPNIKWHDGMPFTSADLVFTLTALTDPEIDIPILPRAELMRSAAAPDPLTFSIEWSGPFTGADATFGLVPMPRHLLESAYLADKADFRNNRWFTTDFVGLGPYRLDAWQQGSHIEFSRFDDYYQGRPPFDRVVVRFLGDSNTMVANILSGAVDIVLPEGVGIDPALEVQRRWEGTGNQVRFDVRENVRMMDIQHRPDLARPVNGLTNRSVRQALLQAIDRQAVSEAVTRGVGPLADSWVLPDAPIRRDLEGAIPQLPYDPARAGALLASLGWVRNADGVLQHSQTGDRFEITINSNVTPDSGGEMAVIADGWKAIGAQPQFDTATTRANPNQSSMFPGVNLAGPQATSLYESRLHSRNISSPANRWSGMNRSGYENPRADILFDQLASEFDASRRLDVHRQLLQEVMSDVAFIPLYWQIVAVLSVKGVRSHKMVSSTLGSASTWNFFDWDRE
jgi:peptide/nickel transport system substrate-binding protein